MSSEQGTKRKCNSANRPCPDGPLRIMSDNDTSISPSIRNIWSLTIGGSKGRYTTQKKKKKKTKTSIKSEVGQQNN